MILTAKELTAKGAKELTAKDAKQLSGLCVALCLSALCGKKNSNLMRLNQLTAARGMNFAPFAVLS